MKVFVMRVGEGIALPVPAHLANQLALSPGDEVDLEGPDGDGILRYVAGSAHRDAAEVRSEPIESSGSEASTADDLPTPGEVAQAVSSGRESIPPPAVLDGEIELLLTTHAAALREVDR